MDAETVLARLHRAMNDHDIEGFLSCIDDDYRSEQPAHPDRAFGGREQVRENWGGIFRDVRDFVATLLRSAVADDTIWAEWRWTGTRTDGTPLDVRGVTLFGVQDGRISWGRLYMELVEEAGADIRETVRTMREGKR